MTLDLSVCGEYGIHHFHTNEVFNSHLAFAGAHYRFAVLSLFSQAIFPATHRTRQKLFFFFFFLLLLHVPDSSQWRLTARDVTWSSAKLPRLVKLKRPPNIKIGPSQGF